MLCVCPPESSQRRNGWDFAHRFGPHCRWHHDQQTWRRFGARPPGWTYCRGGSSGWAEGEGPLRREWGWTVLQLRYQLKEKIGCLIYWLLKTVLVYSYGDIHVVLYAVTEVEIMWPSDDIQLRVNLEGPERSMIAACDSVNHPCHELATAVLSGPL